MEFFETLRQLDLSGVAISAAVHGDGSLHAVGGLTGKLLAALGTQALPRVQTLIVAADQNLQGLGLEPDPHDKAIHIFGQPNNEFHVLQAKTLEAAVELVHLNDKTRWGTRDCCLPEQDSDFVGRERLAKDIRDFVANTDSGYLVIVGGMGRGKSAFLAEFLHRELQRGETPVYHIIKYHPSETGKPDEICRCLYQRLRRKHRFKEPPEWEQKEQKSPPGKLEALLDHLSQTALENGCKEVLYIDAADQAEADARRPLLPGALRNLPRGVLCIITSRTRTDWLRMVPQLTVWDLDDHIDDRADVAQYLRHRERRLAEPLAEGLIEQIVGAESAPVFFTVRSCLNRLHPDDQCTSEAEKRQLRKIPEPWLVPAEEHVEIEAGRVEQEAQAADIDTEDVWETLGVLALAGEDLSREQLDALGLWDKQTRRILQLAGNFFRTLNPIKGPQLPYRFDHPGYHRVVLEKLTTVQRERCHRRLSEGCLDCWKRHDSSAWQYALRHLPRHLIATQEWQELGELLTNWRFLEGKTLAGMVFELATDFSDTIRAIPHDVCSLQLLEKGLRREIHFVARHVDDYPQALFQCLWNFCWWYDCEESIEHFGEFECRRNRRNMPLLSPDRHNLCRLLERWRTQREESAPHFFWLRTLRPPPLHLDSAQRAVLRGHRSWVYAVAFSPDGERLVSGSMDHTLRLWDAHSGAEILVLKGEKLDVKCVSFSPDGRLFASGGWYPPVRVFDARNGAQVAALSEDTWDVRSVAFSPDGQRIVIGASDHTVRVCDVGSGGEVTALRGHEGRVLSVDFSPDGQRIASGSADSTVRVWDVRKGTELRVLRGHNYEVHSVAFSPDGQRIVSGSGDKTVRVWDAHSGTLLLVLPGHLHQVFGVSFSPNGEWIVSASADRTVRVWDARNGAELRVLRGHNCEVHSVAFSPNGEQIISGSLDSTVRVWTVRTSEVHPVLRGHEDWVRSVAFTPDGERIVTGSNDRTVRMWDTHSGREQAVLRGHEDWVSSVAFSPDGKRIVSGSGDGTVRVWWTRSGTRLAVLCGHNSTVTSVAFSPDGKRIVSSSCDDTVRLWDSGSGDMLGILTANLHQFPYRGMVNSVAFSPDGEKIVGGVGGILGISDHNYGVHVWDARSGEQLAVLRGHEGSIESVACSPDGSRIASASQDGTVRVWDVGSGECLDVIRGSGDVQAIAAGSSRFPFRLLTRGGESVVEQSDTARAIAWFPVEVGDIVTHPTGHIWAGADASQLCIIGLEAGGNCH